MFFLSVAARTTPTWWAAKAPLEMLAWSETITPYVLPEEIIASVDASIAPSGSGELQPVAVTVLGQTISLALSGGMPGRIYIVQFLVTMTTGNVYQLFLHIGVRCILAGFPIPPAPVVGFGAAVVWPVADSGLMLDAPLVPNGAFVVVTDTTGWPTSSEGLSGGLPYLNGGFASFTPGGTAFESIAALGYGSVTSAQILQSSSINYPTSDPLVPYQLWLNGGNLCASGG